MTTYYVSNTNGNNNNNGDLSTPFRTISRAISQAAPGDRIVIRGGTYAEQVKASKASLTIQAYESETVILDGSWINGVPNYASLPVTNDWDAMIDVSAASVTIDGLHVRNSGARGVEVSATDCIVKNVTMENIFSAGLLLSRAHRTLVQDVKIVKASLAFAYFGQPWLHKSGKITGWPHTVAPVQTEDSVWRRVEIYEHEGEGFSSYTGIRATWDSCRIVNGTKEMVYLNWSPGFRMFNCEVYFTDGFMPRYGPGSPRSIAFADEIEVEDKRRPQYGPTKDVEIYNNIFVGAHSTLHFSGSTRRSSNAENVLISNNTFIAAPGTDVVNIEQPVSTASSPRSWSNIRIENNIFVGGVRSTVQSQTYKDAITWRNNYWSETPPSWMQSPNDVTGPLYLVSTAAPLLLDENSTTGHDTFDPANYYLTVDSPAIDAGISNEVNTVDIDGTPRGALPDIGFHEYRADTPHDVIMSVDFTVSGTLIPPGESVVLTNESAISLGTIDTYRWEYRLADENEWNLHSTDATPPPLMLEAVGVYELRLTCVDVESDQSKSRIVMLEVGTPVPVINFGRWALLRYGVERGNRVGVDY